MGTMTRGREREKERERERERFQIRGKEGVETEKGNVKFFTEKFEAWVVERKKRFPLQWFKVRGVRGK